MRKTTRAILALSVFLFASNQAVQGETFYLQANKTFSQSDTDKTVWWNAPSGGTSMSALGADYAGNVFDLNGFNYQTRNRSSSSFAGTVVNSDGRLMAYSNDFDLKALQWSASGSRGARNLTMRSSNASLKIEDLEVTGVMMVRANSNELNLNLHADSLTGDGKITFGTDPEEAVGVWGLDIDNSDFTGTIEVNIGKLRFNDTLALFRASLATTSNANEVILANSVNFSSVNVAGTSLATEGTYTAADLNTYFATTRFSGSGTLSILPLVDTIRVETKADGSGTVVPPTSLTAGQSLTVHAIARDSGGNFLSNLPVAWSASNVTGFVSDVDFVPALDGKSATFSGDNYGSAQVTVDGNATNFVPSGVISANAAPLTSATRPFIWATAAERPGILNKITSNDWSMSMASSLIARVQSDLAAYEADRDAYLRELPVDWNHSPTPIFYTTESQVRGPWRNKLNAALDCSILYYLTGNSRYAALAADVLHNSVQSLLNTPLAAPPYGGWTMHDGQWLKESRIIGSQMPLIFDFLHGYLLSNTVWEVDAGGATTFSVADAQTIFDQSWKNCRDWGLGGNNWGALMGSCMIHNIMALDNVTAREDAIDFFIYTGAPRQDSLKEDHDHYDVAAPFSVYPESLGYARGVVSFNTYYMTLIERYDPTRTMYREFSRIPESLHRITQFNFPNRKYQITFGDGSREVPDTIDYLSAEFVYQHAKKLGRTDLTALHGGLIVDGVASGEYDRSTLEPYEDLNLKTKALPLLWAEPTITEPPTRLDVNRTDTIPFAGVAIQRNLSPTKNPDDGLMCFVQGAGFVHSHAAGMNMELYGRGEVLGAKAYGRTKYTRAFASANTVVVNGYSRGSGGWIGVGINTVQTVAMEPAAREPGVSSNISFSTSTFVDDRGNGAEADQQRTMAIIRTSPTTGYYVDLYRSDSSLGGEYHDYIYHNIGDTLSVKDSTGTPLSFSSQPNRFQNDNDNNQSPGWGSFTNTQATSTVTDSVRAQFTTQPTGRTSPIYMDLHIPGDSGREYATALAPAVDKISDPYDDEPIPTLVVRRNGQAWDNPFAVVFEPHEIAESGGTVQSVSKLKQGGNVVGLKVESVVDGENILQYVISNPGANDTFVDGTLGLSFTGRFAVVTEYQDGSGELYIGDGSSLNFGPLRVASQSGNNTQASVLYSADLQTTVTTNDPVDVGNGSDDPEITMVALGTGYVWTDATAWSDALPAHPGAHYFVPASGVLVSPDGNAAFPGTSLTLEKGSSLSVRSRETQGTVTTVNELALIGGSSFGPGDFAEIIAGTRNNETNVITGESITTTGTIRLRGYAGSNGDNPRNLRITHLISGTGTIQSHASGLTSQHTCFIDNPANSFSGTWESLRGGFTFASAEAVGTASIRVLDHGELTIQGNWNQPAATLSVADSTDAKIHLGGNDWTVGELVIGGTPVDSNTYTIAQLNALSDAVFSGTGGMTVIGSNTELEDWRLLYFGTAENNGTAADLFDANFDDEINLLEFATGQDPHAFTLLSTPVTVDGGQVEFRYPRSKAALADGMVFTVEWSDTLLDGSWSTAGVTDGLDPVNPGDSTLENRIATFPEGNSGRRFVRLAITP